MAKRKKTVTAEEIIAVQEVAEKQQVITADAVLESLRAFRNELQRAAELTDDARPKFGVLAIDKFFERIENNG